MNTSIVCSLPNLQKSALPRTVLMRAYEAGDVQMMLHFGQTLRAAGTERIIILAPQGLNNWTTHTAMAAQAGLCMLPCPVATGVGTSLLTAATRAYGLTRPQHLSPVPLPLLPQHWPADACNIYHLPEVKKATQTLQRSLAAALTFLETLRVDALLLCTSNVLSDAGLWIEAMRRRYRPSFVISIGEARPDCNIDIIAQWAEHSALTPLGQAVARHFPHWVSHHHAHPVLALPPAQALAQEIFSMSPPMPWQYNSGRQDYLVVTGEHTQASYLIQGFPPDHVLPLGYPLMDVLHQHHCCKNEGRERLYQHHNLPRAKPLVVCLLPNNRTLSPITQDFDGDHTMLAHTVGLSFASQGWNVLLSPHVASNPAQFHLLQSDKWRVVHSPAMEILPYTDLVVGYGSSVEYWARALGIPDIVYAPFVGYDSLIPRGEGHFEAPAAADLLPLARLLAQPQRLQAVSQLAQRHASYWGMADGKCAERIMQCMATLQTSRAVENTVRRQT